MSIIRILYTFYCPSLALSYVIDFFFFFSSFLGGTELEMGIWKVPQSHLDLELVRSILSEYRIHNADVCLKCDATADDLIDVVEGNRIYVPCLYVLNKIDQISMEELELLDKMPHYVPISAHLEWNLDQLLETCWEYLDLTRMFVLHSLSRSDLVLTS